MATDEIRDRTQVELVAWPIRRRKISEEAVLRLEAMIRDGTFPEGTLLPPERELMKMFGVGRASIREALYALGRMGLVQVRTGERPLVTRPTAENLLNELSGAARHFLAGSGGAEHFQEARALFEVGVARLAALRADRDDIERLRQALEANAAARGDTARFERTDVAFHYVLARITRNPIFTAVHDALVEWLTNQRTITLRAPGAEEAALASHGQIFEAVASNDAEAAAVAMDEHLKSVASLIKAAMEAENATRAPR
ncbi:MAG: transcriptional regulator NanR [Hyphomicrobiales bacterium]|nr:transcriptional regulator NanR [Hyphomicrobiales bacterium]MBV9588055.1 transcriptional regulator NanR [Hyphomicrobiales bacterium]MBV9978278.1 transcriptional regulator NanR [Hyphomicrobiales bacterium]